MTDPKFISDYDLPSDFSFRLHDDKILEILMECKTNGLFDALEFGRKVSQATTQKLKELTDA